MTTDNTKNASATDKTTEAEMQAMARKAKALSIGVSTGKIIGLMGLGALATIGAQKFRNRNA